MFAFMKLSPAGLTFHSLRCDQSQVAASLWAMSMCKLCNSGMWTVTGTLTPSVLLPVTFLPPVWGGTVGRACQLS